MEKLLDCIIDLGEQMLISGGEVHRVEESIKRIFTAYGAKRTDVFIITSSIVVTIHTNEDEIFTHTRRITESGTNFEKLHRLNELSRSICKSKLNPEEIQEKLLEISNAKVYPIWLEFVCYAVIAAAFTLFFGGGIVEAVVSLAIGAIVRFAVLICEKVSKNKIFIKFISSLVVTVFAYVALKLSVVATVDNVIIGNIMTLIPGIGLTNALKDLFMGDSIAGMLRTIEACIAALAIAAGYFAVTLLVGVL